MKVNLSKKVAISAYVSLEALSLELTNSLEENELICFILDLDSNVCTLDFTKRLIVELCDSIKCDLDQKARKSFIKKLESI